MSKRGSFRKAAMIAGAIILGAAVPVVPVVALASQDRPTPQHQPRPQPRPQIRPSDRPKQENGQRRNSSDGTTGSRIRHNDRDKAVSADSVISREFQRRLLLQRLQAAKLIRRIEERKTKERKRRSAEKKLAKKYGLAFVKEGDRQVLVRHGEIIGINLSEPAVKKLADLGFQTRRRTVLSAIGLTMDLLLVPRGMSMKEALAVVKETDKQSYFGYNVAYTPSAYSALGSQKYGSFGTKKSLQASTENAAASRIKKADFSAVVGMIDTGVNAAHEALAGAKILQGNVGRGDRVTPRDHGTAVASILARHPETRIVAVDVFSGPAAYADAESIVLALEFLATSNVGVINMSIAGPANPLLETAVGNLIKRGHIIVAAVGNEGPKGPERFPAAQGDVIGVTAVDAEHMIFEHANQGRAVDYAALGVAVDAASVLGRKKYSGTSFAAPIVAAFLAHQLKKPDVEGVLNAMGQLNMVVTDLGVAGLDPVFGLGLVKY